MVDRNADVDGSLDRVWRQFGKQTEAGKLLYDLYGVRFRPENFVNYPKLRTKPKEEINIQEKTKMSRPKSSSNLKKAAEKINYPEVNMKREYKFNKVDFIPKRRKENVIKSELEQIKNNMIKEANKANPNTHLMNRKAQIETLQDKFMFQERTVMPKGARLPGVNQLNKINNKESKFEPEESEHREIKFKPSNKKEELQYLYSQIMKEIDERYVYMEEMKKLGKNMDLIIMGEIRERLDELKKLKKLIDECR